MTREEIITKIKSFCHNCEKFPTCVNTDKQCFKALDMAIEALSAEPCDDCVNRLAARNCITFNEVRYRMIEDFDRLPSVQPKPKYVAVGNVNFDKDELQKIIDKVNPTIIPEIEYRKAHWQNNACSNCGIYNASAYKNWCPNCGAKMLEPQERSDKE